MGCGVSRRPTEMQVIHPPWSWYGGHGGRIAPVIEPEESLHRSSHNVNWWYSDQLDLDESYRPRHILVPQDTSAEPPPYTEVAQNGHVSLMHGHSPIKPADCEQPSLNDTNMEYSALTANNGNNLEVSHGSVTEHNQSFSSEMDTTSSFDSSTQQQNPFHPTRQSTPILERRQVLQLPPLHRSRSVHDSPAGTVVDEPLHQHRHSVSGVPLTFRTDLPQLGHMQSNAVSENVENVGPFPVRPGRLPPLQRGLHVQLDQQHNLSSSFGSQNGQKRKKKRRKRTRSWHGEEIATEIIPTIHEVNALSPVAE